MQFQGKALSIHRLEDDIYEVRFDLENSSVNKINEVVLDELRQVVELFAANKQIKGCVFSSGKPMFIVGADIPMFFPLIERSDSEIEDWLMSVHKLFADIQSLPFVTVSAINGFALGGGLEFVSASDYRVMLKDAKIGVPEVHLGIFPGWAGTVRLPRIIGIEKSFDWICTGRHVGPDEAKDCGLVEAVVDQETELLTTAVEIIKRSHDLDKLREAKSSTVSISKEEQAAIDQLRARYVKTEAHYPAPVKAIDCMLEHLSVDAKKASHIEVREFTKLLKTGSAVNLLWLFINDQAANRAAKAYAKQTDPVQSAAVIGAGIMGGGISYQSALKQVPVVMKDINQEALDLGLKEADRNFQRLVKKGRMNEQQKQEALTRITATLDDDAVTGAEIIIEAVVENPDVKKKVLSSLEKQVADNCVLASNTSTISITELAESLDKPERFCGIHFFNPVPIMPLVEVIRGEKSSDETIAKAVNYVLRLGKKPVVLNDCPGFLVNRVLFPYLNAFQLLMRDGADFQQVDKVMEQFGWPMGPAYLMDVIGMDTICHATDVLAEGFPDRMELGFEITAEKLFKVGRLGQKSGSGYYQYQKSDKGRLQKVVDNDVYKLIGSEKTKAFSEEEIVQRMMIPICLEMVRCIEEGIVGSAAEADMSLIWGIGFPRFRGGALRYIETVGLQQFCKHAEQYQQLGAMYVIPELLKQKSGNKESFFTV